MPIEMTENACAVLGCARQEARWFGSGAVESIHLLLGITRQPDATAARVLQALGINAKKVALTLGTTAPETRPDMTGDLPCSPNLKTILAAAEDAARAGTRVRLGSEHLLLGIMAVPHSRAAKLLARFELTPAAVAEQVARTLAEHKTPEITQGDLAAVVDLDVHFAAAGPDATRNVYRILDANLNRAGEAVRVIEDCARFILDHPVLAQEAKSLRHRLRHAMDTLEIPSAQLLEARAVTSDVGTLLTSVGDVSRATLSTVLRANFRRLAESLRTLEEYAKLARKPFDAFERLRYDAYELEKHFAQPLPKRASLDDVSLYVLVSASSTGRSTLEVLEEVLDGGCRMVQLREKNLPDRQLLELARAARQLTHRAGALLIINDRADLAHRVGADGVHLGQSDLPVHEARRIIGFDRLVGVSTHSPEQAFEAEAAGADYIGVGPVFASPTKPGVPVAGPELLRAIADIRLPFFPIGGITLDTLPGLRALGASRLALSSAVINSPDICETTRAFLHALRP